MTTTRFELPEEGGEGGVPTPQAGALMDVKVSLSL